MVQEFLTDHGNFIPSWCIIIKSHLWVITEQNLFNIKKFEELLIYIGRYLEDRLEVNP